MERMDSCPFCGCDMRITEGKYPNGDEMILPYGWHNLDCILRVATFYTYPEEGWTVEKITEAWNRRAK